MLLVADTLIPKKHATKCCSNEKYRHGYNRDDDVTFSVHCNNVCTVYYITNLNIFRNQDVVTCVPILTLQAGWWR